jgi:hypothetical protein
MAADDHVASAECRHRVFDAGRDADGGRFVIDRRDVSGIALDEQVARAGMRDQLWHHAAVCAGEKQRLRLLAPGEALEQRATGWEDVASEAVHAAAQFVDVHVLSPGCIE